MAKVNALSDGALVALAALEAAPKGSTLQELNAVAAEKIASAHLTALARRGLVTSEKVEKEVVSVRTVNAYTITDEGTNYEQPAAE